MKIILIFSSFFILKKHKPGWQFLKPPFKFVTSASKREPPRGKLWISSETRIQAFCRVVSMFDEDSLTLGVIHVSQLQRAYLCPYWRLCWLLLGGWDIPALFLSPGYLRVFCVDCHQHLLRNMFNIRGLISGFIQLVCLYFKLSRFLYTISN